MKIDTIYKLKNIPMLQVSFLRLWSLWVKVVFLESTFVCFILAINISYVTCNEDPRLLYATGDLPSVNITYE